LPKTSPNIGTGFMASFASGQAKEARKQAGKPYIIRYTIYSDMYVPYGDTECRAVYALRVLRRLPKRLSELGTNRTWARWPAVRPSMYLNVHKLKVLQSFPMGCKELELSIHTCLSCSNKCMPRCPWWPPNHCTMCTIIYG
jgi:hypothetical protein